MFLAWTSRNIPLHEPNKRTHSRNSWEMTSGVLGQCPALLLESKGSGSRRIYVAWPFFQRTLLSLSMERNKLPLTEIVKMSPA